MTTEALGNETFREFLEINDKLLPAAEGYSTV